MATYTRVFPGRPDQVAHMRHWAEHCLSCPALDTPIPDDTVASAVLLISEAATNAIRHTRSGQPGGEVGIYIRLSESCVSVVIGDDGAPTRPHLRDHGPLAEDGRGLALMEAFADDWNACPAPDSGIIFRLDVPQAPRLRLVSGCERAGWQP
ncbi:ATP-binding protein [Nocardiopsis rhodophaea]|uniref:ATP-binding protein n=1 Tax=Nocardiopsis rhodophaea TaxID=280238 RepID=UPI0031D52987